MREKVGEKQLSRREFLIRGAAFGAATAGLGALVPACGYGGAAGSGADRPVTMPIHTGPWLPSYQAMVKLYQKETGNRVELVPYPLQQVLSKQLIDTDAESGEYDIYLLGESQAAEFYDAGFVTPFEEIDPGFRWPEGRDAALVDGCTGAMAFWRVMLPLAAPGVAAVTILVAVLTWNDFLMALSLTLTPNAQTITVGVANFMQNFSVQFGELTAASAIATVPLVILAALAHRYIVAGLTGGALKE